MQQVWWQLCKKCVGYWIWMVLTITLHMQIVMQVFLTIGFKRAHGHQLSVKGWVQKQAVAIFLQNLLADIARQSTFAQYCWPENNSSLVKLVKSWPVPLVFPYHSIWGDQMTNVLNHFFHYSGKELLKSSQNKPFHFLFTSGGYMTRKDTNL